MKEKLELLFDEFDVIYLDVLFFIFVYSKFVMYIVDWVIVVL